MRTLFLFSSLILSAIDIDHRTEFKVASSNEEPTIEKKVAAPDPEKPAILVEADLSYLMKGGWKILSITADKPCDVNGDGYETTDILSETPVCALDDVMKIYANHTVSFERHKRCVATERAIETYKWKLSKEGVFTFVDGSIESQMILKSVGASRLVMLIPMEEDGEIFHFKVTYGQTEKTVPGKILKN